MTGSINMKCFHAHACARVKGILDSWVSIETSLACDRCPYYIGPEPKQKLESDPPF